MHANANSAGFVKETENPTNYLEKLGVFAQQKKHHEHHKKHFKLPPHQSTARLFDWNDNSEKSEE